MARIVEDTSGQWIVLSGLAISMSLITVAVLVSQAAITGYYSSYAALEFPKDKIRDLTAQTHETVKSAAQLAWELNHTSNQSVRSNFTELLNNYSSQVNMIFAAHGMTINITLSNITNQSNPVFNSSTNKINTVFLNITYNDCSTNFASEPEEIEVNL